MIATTQSKSEGTGLGKKVVYTTSSSDATMPRTIDVEVSWMNTTSYRIVNIRVPAFAPSAATSGAAVVHYAPPGDLFDGNYVVIPETQPVYRANAATSLESATIDSDGAILLHTAASAAGFCPIILRGVQHPI